MPTIQYNSQLGTSDAAVITAASTTSIALTRVIAINTTGGAVTVNVTIHRAQSGAVETLASAMSIPATSAVPLTENRLLALGETLLLPGDTLHAWAGAGTSITLLCF